MAVTPVKSYSKKELAALYKIPASRLLDWVRPFADEVANDYKRIRVLKPNQVAVIFDRLGRPEE